jgi:transposase-like protein
MHNVGRLVRKGGRVVSQALLVAAAITDQGRRQIVGWSVGDSESEATWSELFLALKRRGMKGVELVVSDAHGGIRAALARHWQGASWQRCQVHLLRELLNKVSYKEARELSADLRAIFAPASCAQCRRVAGEVCEKWAKRAPKMVASLEEALEDCLTVQELPPQLRRRLKSTNLMERLMRELKRRSRVVSIFPSVEALGRLGGALLLEQQETWLAESQRYLVLERQAS